MTDKTEVTIDPNAGPDPTLPPPAIEPPPVWNTPGFKLNNLPWWIVGFLIIFAVGFVYALVRHP